MAACSCLVYTYICVCARARARACVSMYVCIGVYVCMYCTNVNMHIFTMYICTHILYSVSLSIKYVLVYSTPSSNWIWEVSVTVVYECMWLDSPHMYWLQRYVVKQLSAGLSQKYPGRFCLQHCFGIHSTILGKFANRLQTVTVRRVTVTLVTSSCFYVCRRGTTRFPSGWIFITFSYRGLIIKYVDGIQFWVQNISCFTWRRT